MFSQDISIALKQGFKRMEIETLIETTTPVETHPPMQTDTQLEHIMSEILSLKEELQELKQELKGFQQSQQESIMSLIALSQQQTTVIEQQNSTLQRVVSNGNHSSR
jgi:hypothetical protein